MIVKPSFTEVNNWKYIIKRFNMNADKYSCELLVFKLIIEKSPKSYPISNFYNIYIDIFHYNFNDIINSSLDQCHLRYSDLRFHWIYIGLILSNY